MSHTKIIRTGEVITFLREAEKIPSPITPTIEEINTGRGIGVSIQYRATGDNNKIDKTFIKFI